MEDRTHDITCPCCGALISVDAGTGAILAHESPKTKPISFEKAAGEVAKGKKRAEDRFSQAMDERSRQGEILEKKLKKAIEKAAEDDSPPRSPFDLE